MRKKTEQEKQAEKFFRIIMSQLDDILCEVKDSYDNEDEPTLDRIHLDLHNLFLKIKREKASEEGASERVSKIRAAEFLNGRVHQWKSERNYERDASIRSWGKDENRD